MEEALKASRGPSSGEDDPPGGGAGAQGFRLRSVPWPVRFRDQFVVLCYKNFLVSIRSYRATLLRLLSPVVFMLLLFLVDVAMRADNPLEPVGTNPAPAVEPVGAIPDCAADLYARTPCYDFLYTPGSNGSSSSSSSAAVQAVVEGMRANNPGRPIPPDKVLGLASAEEVNAWLLANPERTTGVVHFHQDGAKLAFSLQTNTSVKFFRGAFQDPTFFAQVPLQVAAEREIARWYWAQAGRDPAELEWDVALSIYPHPRTAELNIVGTAMGPFVFATNLFSFVMLLAGVVSEKEAGLRQALRTMGMLDSALWLSWLATEAVAAAVFTLVLIGVGAALQFSFFLANSFALVFVLFFLFQLAMISVSLLLSTFISRAASAVTWGFGIFILGWIVQSVVAFGFPYSPGSLGVEPWLTALITLMPWSMLAKGSLDLGKATLDAGSPGLGWAQRHSYCTNTDDGAGQLAGGGGGAYFDGSCVVPLGLCFYVLLAQFAVYLVAAVYLDNVLPDKNGVCRRPWYFLSPSYWCGAGRRLSAKHAVHTALGVGRVQPSRACPEAATEGQGASVDADVAAEEERMRELLRSRAEGGCGAAAQADALNALEVFGLQRVYQPGLLSRMLPRWCRWGGRGFWAVQGSWFAVERGRCFCLLGPNGAGKTTTINMLTGVLPASGGDALVYGEALRSPGGMDRIRSVMGVCPQFDVLWGSLTGLEHMHLYGRIKGIPRAQLRQQAAELLERVRLTPAARLRTAAYSGGMRRRLSVALALLGDPLVVYLDEPSTGMDPISRRHVWDIIERAKAARAIVLTTHSMEEAEQLADQVAIMARGRVGAIGSSLRLKQRFGSGYQLSVSVGPAPLEGSGGGGLAAVPEARAAGVKAFFKAELDVAPVDESWARMVFSVPQDREERLHGFLRRLEARRGGLGIVDVQITLSSLEEVFLSVARKAELEAAAAEGRSSVRVLLEGGGALQVPLGEEVALDPATGLWHRLTWAQDEQGMLQVVRCTPLSREESDALEADCHAAPAVVTSGDCSSNWLSRACDGGGKGSSEGSESESQSTRSRATHWGPGLRSPASRALPPASPGGSPGGGLRGPRSPSVVGASAGSGVFSRGGSMAGRSPSLIVVRPGSGRGSRVGWPASASFTAGGAVLGREGWASAAAGSAGRSSSSSLVATVAAMFGQGATLND